MSWTLEQILDRADELAGRFEAFDPSEAVEVPVAEYLLHRAVRASLKDQAHLVDALTAAREAGTSWTRIGEILGIPGPEAERRYGSPVEPLERAGQTYGGQAPEL